MHEVQWGGEYVTEAPWRVIGLAIRNKELLQLRSIARSRMEAAARVARARMLLAYVLRWVVRWAREGVLEPGQRPRFAGR
jgi:hypothetical protein